MENKKLFYVTTVGCGSYYVIAETFDSASHFVEEMLNKDDYGFYDHRKVREIKVLSEESKYSGESDYRAVSDSTKNLIIVK